MKLRNKRMRSATLQILMTPVLLGSAALLVSSCAASKNHEPGVAANYGGKTVLEASSPKRPSTRSRRKFSTNSSATLTEAPKLTPDSGDIPQEKPIYPMASTEVTEPLDDEMVKPVKMAPVNHDEMEIAAPPIPKRPVLVSNNRVNKIITANGADVQITGSDSVLVISGGCSKLVLSGSRNQVQCDSATSIEVLGHENNVVLGLVGDGVISGNQNQISWGAGIDCEEPLVRSTGFDNVSKRLE